VGGILGALIILTIIISVLTYKLRKLEISTAQHEIGLGNRGPTFDANEGPGEFGGNLAADRDVFHGGRLGTVMAEKTPVAP
jgi:hypothetical protein